MKTVSMNHDIEIDDFISKLTKSQQTEVFEKMQDELKMVPRTVESLFKGHSFRDSELGKALFDLWDARDNLNENQRARIIEITKESYI